MAEEPNTMTTREDDDLLEAGEAEKAAVYCLEQLDPSRAGGLHAGTIVEALPEHARRGAWHAMLGKQPKDELSFDEAFRGLLGGLKLLSDEEASFARARLEKMGKPSEEDFSSLPVLLPEVEGAMGELKGIMAEEALKVARGDEWDELGFRPREWQPFDPVRWLGQRLKRRALEVEGDAE